MWRAHYRPIAKVDLAHKVSNAHFLNPRSAGKAWRPVSASMRRRRDGAHRAGARHPRVSVIGAPALHARHRRRPDLSRRPMGWR